MKKIITKPQKTDMGSGFGVYEFSKKDTLLDFLQWHKNTGDTWGVISIFNKNNECIRKFDYDLYDNMTYYHHLSNWEYNLSLKEIKFEYCFMCEDIQIYLGD